MGRPRRIHLPNCFVLVSQRCNHGEELLRHPAIKAMYLAILAQVAREMGYEVVYFCLQDNHIHLLLRTPAEIAGHTLAAFMHRVNSAFGHQLNACRGWSGTAWQGRYKATGWFPVQRLLLLELMLWYLATNTARRRRGAVAAAMWPWGSLYWLLRGAPGPVPTTLATWLERIYRPRGRADPAAAFAELAAETERPDWSKRARELERQGLPWRGQPDRPTIRQNLRVVTEAIHRLNLRSWKLELERYSILLLPQLQVTT